MEKELARPLTAQSTWQLEERLPGLIRRGEVERAAEVSAILERRRNRGPKKRPPTILRIRSAARPFASWRPVIEDICKRRQVTINSLMTTSRQPSLVEARHEIWWTIRTRFGTSLEQIGARLGGFDHTSVRHGVLIWQKRLGAQRAAA